MTQIKIVQGDLTSQDVDALVVNLGEGVSDPGGATAAIDEALGGQIKALIADGEIKGKAGEITILYTFGKLPAKRVAVAGLGKLDELTVDRLRDTAANVGRRLRGANVRRAATVLHGAGAGGIDTQAAAQALAEGTLLGLYRFTKYQTQNEEANSQELEALTIVERDPDKIGAIERGVEVGRVLADATNLARDLANEPSSNMTPADLAAVAQQLALDNGLECEIIEREQMEEMGMGALLGVARGSAQAPKLIVLRYRGSDSSKPSLGLIGKGVTFDSGGISIKPADGMDEMKTDMSGGACCIAAMQAIAALKPRIGVTAVVPAVENMPSGTAYKPGDILQASSGKTIEVLNTDAEGRLILADALSYARKQGLSPLVDVATLTGAIVVALGKINTGAFTNNQAFMDQVKAAAQTAGEKVWQLPMDEDYKEQIKSEIADLKNTGGRGAGSITAALFLQAFAEDTPWVHLDIAGTSRADKDKGVTPKGGSGVPVRTLVQLAFELSKDGE